MNNIDVSSLVHAPLLQNTPASRSPHNAADMDSLHSDKLTLIQSALDSSTNLSSFYDNQEEFGNNLECPSVSMPNMFSGRQFLGPEQSSVTQAFSVSNSEKSIKTKREREEFIEKIIEERAKNPDMPWKMAAENCNDRLETDERFSAAKVSRFSTLARKIAAYRARRIPKPKRSFSPEADEQFRKELFARRVANPNISCAEHAASLNRIRKDKGKKTFRQREVEAFVSRISKKCCRESQIQS